MDSEPFSSTNKASLDLSAAGSSAGSSLETLTSPLMPDLQENGSDNFHLLQRSSEEVVAESPAPKKEKTKRQRRKGTTARRISPLIKYSPEECLRAVNSGNFPVLNSMPFLEPTLEAEIPNLKIVNPQIEYCPCPSTVPFPPPPLNTVKDGVEDCKVADERMMQIIDGLPKVTVDGIKTIQAKVEGVYYMDNGDVCVICCCHGWFLTPPKFVRHAGGSDEESLHARNHIRPLSN